MNVLAEIGRRVDEIEARVSVIRLTSLIGVLSLRNEREPNRRRRRERDRLIRDLCDLASALRELDGEPRDPGKPPVDDPRRCWT